jgi:hypothetical protein
MTQPDPARVGIRREFHGSLTCRSQDLGNNHEAGEENNVQWQYRTILFEFQKDGLLGDKYVDDEEVERILNEQGEQGWELVSVTTVQEGLLTFFKRMQAMVGQSVAKSGQPETQRAVPAAKPAPPVPQPAAPRQQPLPAAPQQIEEPIPPKKKGGAIGEIKIS